jgi:hypothetical protein
MVSEVVTVVARATPSAAEPTRPFTVQEADAGMRQSKKSPSQLGLFFAAVAYH